MRQLFLYNELQEADIMLFIFDLDGTLTNTLPAIAYFGNLALEAHGFRPFEQNLYKNFVGDGMDVLIHRMLTAQNADSDENFVKVRKTYDDAYKNDLLHSTRTYDGIPETLDELKKRGDKLAVLSNKPHHAVAPIINKLFGDTFFNSVHGQTSAVPRKPAPDGALAICAQLDEYTKNTIFVGDTNVDITTGKNAGMTTVGVTWGFRDKQELSDAGADYIISKPIELLYVKNN
jgi:phosphoglycolate phosphatase